MLLINCRFPALGLGICGPRVTGAPAQLFAKLFAKDRKSNRIGELPGRKLTLDAGASADSILVSDKQDARDLRGTAVLYEPRRRLET